MWRSLLGAREHLKESSFQFKAVLYSACVGLVKEPDNKVSKLYRKRIDFIRFLLQDFEDFCFDNSLKRS